MSPDVNHSSTDDFSPGSSNPTLPVNSEPESWEPARVRISRACDRCKKRKVRCSGSQPCDTCIRAVANCLYAAPYRRGRPPAPTARRHDARSGGHEDEVLMGSDSPQFGLSQRSDPPAPEIIENSDMTTGELPSRASPEPITDLQGHYIGPASGVSFIARVQKRLNQGNHASSNFTFGDVPLPDFDPIPSVMISSDEGSRLVQKFFDFTMPIDRFFDQPTIEEWLKEFCETMGSMRNVEDAPARRAALWMIFAMAQEHMSQEPNTGDDHKSIRFFLAADYQLSKSRSTVSLTAVQARLCQCFWLLARSRVNHCWDLFGSTARLALVLGLHRKQSPAITSNREAVHLDCSRRTFWSAYCLDNHLSITFGRPKIFHDDDIDQEMSCTDDPGLFMNHQISSQPAHHNSIMFAPVAYYKLHSILSKVLRDLYSIRPASVSVQCSLASKYSQQLKDWREKIPRFLKEDNQEPIPLIPIFRRQRDTLTLSFWHIVMLMHRPLLLRKAALVHRGGRDDSNSTQLESSVGECLAAAMHIIKKVEEMFQSGLMFRSFWGTCYYGFSAAVVLYVYTIMLGVTAAERGHKYLDAAIQYQSMLSTITGNGSLLARYWVVLEELREEALRRTQPDTDSLMTTQDLAVADVETMSFENLDGILYAPIAYPDIFGSVLGVQPATNGNGTGLGDLSVYNSLDWQS